MYSINKEKNMTTRTLLKFTRPVKELKDLGFTFHKMFASNYKAYNLDLITDETYSVWLYVKGHDVEFGGFFSQTALVMDTVKSEIEKGNLHNDRSFLKQFNPNFTEDDISYTVKFWINRETSLITSYEDYHKNQMKIFERFHQIDKSEYKTDEILRGLYVIQKSYGNSVIMDVKEYEKFDKLFKELGVVREIKHFFT